LLKVFLLRLGVGGGSDSVKDRARLGL
jgi:hypothetical protein